VGLPCVSLLGSQLAPEDLIGVPQVVDGTSRFCPPRQIARAESYCLFLDELNACTHEVQEAFYSLIHERRLGEYELPPGSVVIGAGNRAGQRHCPADVLKASRSDTRSSVDRPGEADGGSSHSPRERERTCRSCQWGR
jgi:MoxR-like ATPase